MKKKRGEVKKKRKKKKKKRKGTESMETMIFVWILDLCMVNRMFHF